MTNLPFTSIIGQQELKLALSLNIVDPNISGLLIMGDRGTGKSTTVRSTLDLLPEIKVVKDDPLNRDPSDPSLQNPYLQFTEANLTRDKSPKNTLEKSNTSAPSQPLATAYQKIPLITLPLGATEDRVCGTLDIEKALTTGMKSFEPGLLAKANKGVLYVDEVNLLDDHLVDILLDSAASGVNTVEREGISISHPAKFILIGSGNPEEGELRPQLLDRFGMYAEIRTLKNPKLRVQIVNQRTDFDKDPNAFILTYQEKQNTLKNQILKARELIQLNQVAISEEYQINISEICSLLKIDGIRGDIICNRAAKALAAFNNKTTVEMEDILEILYLCLRHRLGKDPLESITNPKTNEQKINDAAIQVFKLDEDFFEKRKKKEEEGEFF